MPMTKSNLPLYVFFAGVLLGFIFGLLLGLSWQGNV
jgi:hypothetical protein